jgi:signal transduction histidine kinase
MACILFLAVRSRLRRVLEMERLRVRIAADLHDDVGTNLSSVMLGAQIMERKYALTGAHLADLRRLRSTAERTQEMLRDIVWFLDPGNDSGEDFILKLKELAGRILQDLPFQFHVTGKDAPRHLSLEMKRNIVLMVKESLTNIVKHAHAASVAIEVAYGNGVFALSIRDNGGGFDTSAESPGNGIANLRRRASDIGGTLELQSAPGQGTLIRLTVNITHMRSIKAGSRKVR